VLPSAIFSFPLFAFRNSAGQVPKESNPRVPLRSSGQSKKARNGGTAGFARPAHNGQDCWMIDTLLLKDFVAFGNFFYSTFCFPQFCGTGVQKVEQKGHAGHNRSAYAYGANAQRSLLLGS
jgi:hypothetical protein